MNDTVCAVVVTYNRKDLLIECLEAICRQTRRVQAIYIIDNASTDHTPELLREKGYINELPPAQIKEPWEKEFTIRLAENSSSKESIKLVYRRMHENTGGAGGFYEGVKRGYENAYDWLWLMDDDGLPDESCLEHLLKYKNMGDFLAPLVISKHNECELSFGIYDYKNNKTIRNVNEVVLDVYHKTANPFNGILISKELIKRVGYPKKEMFIWGDEVEYQLRTLNNDLKVLTVANAVHYHPKGRVKVKDIINMFKIDWHDNRFISYCIIRNRAYIKKKYSGGIIYLWKDLGKYFISFVLFKITLKDFVFVIRAMKDGVSEKWGKEKSFLN